LNGHQNLERESKLKGKVTSCPMCANLTSTAEIDDTHFASLAAVTWGLHSFGRFHKHDPKIVSKDDVKK
jgi:hypothetical protein